MTKLKRVMKFTKSTSILLATTLLISGCSNFFLGKENLLKEVKLPKQTQKINFKKSWRNSVGNGTGKQEIKLTPATDGKNIYAVSENGVLISYSATGKKNWKVKIGHDISSGVASAGGILIVGTKNGILFAYRADNGKALWRYQLSSEILAKPLITKNAVIASTIDGQVVAINPNTGNTAWKYYIGVASLSIRGNATPMALPGAILFTNAKGRITMLDEAQGREIFSAAVVVGKGKTIVDRIVDLVATPTISQGILYVSSYRYKTLAIDLKSGSLVWKSPNYSSKDLFVDGRYLYVIDKNSIITALNKKDGSVAWTSKDLVGRKISPVSGDNKNIFVIDRKGILSVIDASTGTYLSSKSIGSKQSYVAPLYLGGTSWATFTRDGKLTVLSITN